MTEDVSASIKLGVLLLMLSTVLASVLLIYYNSSYLLSSIQNKSIDVVNTVNINNIVSLSKDYRRYIDIYKAYEYYGGNINSITGRSLETNPDGTTSLSDLKVHYLLNADHIDSNHVSSSDIRALNYTGYVGADNMYSSYLGKYCTRTHSNDWIKITITKSITNNSYDIYYEQVDLGGR